MLLFRSIERVRRALGREDGAATIEAILWLPFFLGLFSLMVDISMIFNNQSRITRIIQDGNRQYSVDWLDSTSAVETYVVDKVKPISASATAQTTVSLGIITTTVTVPLKDLDLLGLTYVFGGNWQITADHMYEWYAQ